MTSCHRTRSSPNLRDKVEIESPRRPVDEIRVTVKEGTDPSKIDERFLEKFRSEMSFSRTKDQRTLVFKIRSTVGSQIRERAVGQAKDIILRRVDELGLREAAVSSRDEDIIVEVPGEDEKSFATIRNTISQTARLEFKLLGRRPRISSARCKRPPRARACRKASNSKSRTRRPGKTPRGEKHSKRPPTRSCARGAERDLDSGAAGACVSGSARWRSPPIAKSVTHIESRVVDELSLKEEENRYPHLLPQEPCRDHRRHDP